MHKNQCELVREGGNHSVFANITKKKVSAVPRHSEIKNFLVKKICKDLEIPLPESFQ
jgi:mRNA interferase HicA